MNTLIKRMFTFFMLLMPIVAFSQVTTPSKDSTTAKPDSIVTVKIDSVKVVVDTLVKKDCYTEYYDIFRGRGAKAVTDGKHLVVIAVKGPNGCHCYMGQVEVVGGKIKPPMMIQAENGDFRAASSLGKKLEPAFVASMTPDELYSVKDGMSIVFRTADQEYGRVFFYTFINKGGGVNKAAPSAAELLKE